MTGTGTQSDPYIPTTLTEFITAVGTSGAYVALTQDINAADDPEYSGEIARITCNCAEVDGGGHTVQGITVRDPCFFYHTVSHHSNLRNINLRDIALKKGDSADGAAFWSTVRDYAVWFYDSTISLKIDLSGGRGSITHFSFFTDCALDVEYTGTGYAGNGTALFQNCVATRLTSRISGWDATSTYVFHSGLFTRSAFVFDGAKGSFYLSHSNGSPRNLSYFAFVNYSPSGGSISTANGGNDLNLVATDADTAAVNLTAGWKKCSIDQLKDKNYLSSVGWLP